MDKVYQTAALEIFKLARNQPDPAEFIRDIISRVRPRDEDNISADLIELMSDADLAAFAGTPGGRRMLDTLYEAIITGDVTAFETSQAARILDARHRSLPHAHKPDTVNEALRPIAVEIQATSFAQSQPFTYIRSRLEANVADKDKAPLRPNS